VTFVGNISGLTNVPKSRVEGAELEWQWAPVAGLNLGAALTYLDTKVLEWQATDPVLSVWPDVVTFDASGTELPQAPKWTYNGYASYRWPVSSGLYVQLGADFNHTDTTSGGANAFAFATKAYTLVNARIELGDAGDKWSAQLWSHNLTDEFYYPSAFVANGPFVRIAGMPRTVGISLDYHW
jgi:iron complex outermembrane receptor protein